MHGVYVDTGLMREGETEFVRASFAALGASGFGGRRARELPRRAREASSSPKQKRHVIGEEFVTVQQRILESEHFLEGEWILGQGTIYPDTIESGGSLPAANPRPI